MGRRLMALAGAAVVVGLMVLAATAMPAGAELNGPCQASGTIQETGLTIDPAASDGPFEVPLEGTVEWQGQVGDSGDETEPRSTNGAIAVVAPPLFDAVFGPLLEFRDWGDDDAVTTSESGTDGYTLPDYTPRDTEIVVEGFHDDPVGNCDGQVTVVVEGSAFDSPFTWASLAGTVIMAGGVVVAGMPKGAR